MGDVLDKVFSIELGLYTYRTPPATWKQSRTPIHSLPIIAEFGDIRSQPKSDII